MQRAARPVNLFLPCGSRALLLWGGALVCLLLSGTLFAGRYLTEEEALKIAFPGSDKIEKKLTVATDSQREKIAALRDADKSAVPRFFSYYEGRQDGQLLGYAVIDEVIGKHKPITYMLAFTPDLRVKAIEILVYRESYGYEIRQENFRQQFFGKGIEDPLRLNHEIRNISGATISCRSIIRAVRDQLTTMEVLVPKSEPRASAETATRKAVDSDARSTEEPLLRRRSQLLMGTLLEINAYAPALPNADVAISAAFDEVERIENLLSTFSSATVISQLNRDGYDKPIFLGAETWQLLMRSQAFSKETEGWFAVTVGPLVRLWREADGTDQLPSPERIAQAKHWAAPSALLLLDGHQAQLATPHAEVDLGAIGKGYALDRAAEILRQHGIDRALLNFGGHILAMDPPPGEDGWEVFIRHPSDENLALARISAANESIATSADSERALVIGSQAFSHIIDSHSGHPASAALSATVIAKKAEHTDAWATALFAMGPGKAAELGRNHDLSFLLLSKDGSMTRLGDRFSIAQAP